ncbi:MAG TPA: DNA polymerase III subunit delta' [Desulfosarcina sp.]|nr:DNA polymerase III subunit delta' [Desulfosarcina sp.]
MTTAIGFNAIVGQQHPIRLLKTFVRNAKLPHALLFTGDDGVGKRMAARAFAMACNCKRLTSELPRQPGLDAVDACGSCVPCRKIAGDNHPDILHVAPRSSVIRIAQIRELLQTLTLKPNEACRRVVILSDAQAMNAEAGNALLKVLEEPPDRTLLVLTARQSFDLLPTVVSRCRHIRFAPLDEADIEHLLGANEGMDPRAAATVAALCGGSYTRARLWSDGRWLGRREWILRVLNDLTARPGRPDIRSWLALSERLSRQKDRVEEALEIITMWLRDILVADGDPRQVLNRDRLQEISAASRRIDRRTLLAQADAVDRARAALQANTNTRLTLDAMVLQMAGTCSR